MRKSLGAFSPTKAFDTSLKKQFEQQSEQVAVLLSSLQKVTIELEEARDSTKKQVADARQESKEALKAADARAAEVNDEMIALQKQHEDEVRREGRAHACAEATLPSSLLDRLALRLARPAPCRCAR